MSALVTVTGSLRPGRLSVTALRLPSPVIFQPDGSEGEPENSTSLKKAVPEADLISSRPGLREENEDSHGMNSARSTVVSDALMLK